MEQKSIKQEKIEQYGAKIMELAKDTITVRFRFFDRALTNLKLVQKPGIGGFATDGTHIYYDPAALLLTYIDEPNVAVRAYLHMLMHCIFFHSFQCDKKNPDYWDMAVDVAVENIILELNLPAAALSKDGEISDQLRKIKKWVPELTAEKIYREFMINGLSHDAEDTYKRLFTVDLHDIWHQNIEKIPEEVIMTEEQWRKVSERIKTELKDFSKDKEGTDSLENNLEEATKERYHYGDILERFSVMGEEITVNDDEFDYIYYTYGLKTYGNLPLIEPLEYKEVHKVKEFVVAIDTSASCRGSIVKAFLEETYNILKRSENFFHDINIHIIQCDANIQSDQIIKNDADFKDFIENGKLNGFGATDFRPVFSYVDGLIEQGAFENLKGLIYFTDGYGIYPEKMPDYDVIFAFLNEDDNRLKVPNWAIEVIIEEEALDKS
ncbi:MAG: VWA-like domain-containing protein [Lachnospiraceae bacterium]